MSDGSAGMQLPPEFGIRYPNIEEGRNIGAKSAMRKYDADVVIVGSGAGGAPAARRMADAGLDVLILEEGELHKTESFSTDLIEQSLKLYRDAGSTMITGRPPIIFTEGRCVGGSTVINGGMSWRTPDRVLEYWSRELGLDDTDPKAMEPYFEQAEEILNVEYQNEDTLGRNDKLFVRGARKLGWEVKDNPRNMKRCVGLNNCGIGCPTGAKQSMLVTEIPRALAGGARMVTSARATKILFHGGRVSGIAGRFVTPLGRRLGRFEVRARMVVLAAGARFTPGILKRSWLRNPMIGRGLHTHPNAKVIGVFEERVDPTLGTHQAHQIHHFLEEGLLFGYAAIQPGLLAATTPGFGEEHGRRMEFYHHMLTAGVLVEDTGEGRVVMGPDLQPYMRFTLDKADVERVHLGVRLLAEQMFAAGAYKVFTPFGEMPELKSPDDLGRIDARKHVRHDLELLTVHIMSSARMRRTAKDGACDSAGRVHDTPGLAIADASVIPSSIGVNPMETIVALALRNSDRWIDDLKRG